jgi:hypothetical protein
MRDITEAPESSKMREPETPRMQPHKRETPKLPNDGGGHNLEDINKNWLASGQTVLPKIDFYAIVEDVGTSSPV